MASNLNSSFLITCTEYSKCLSEKFSSFRRSKYLSRYSSRTFQSFMRYNGDRMACILRCCYFTIIYTCVYAFATVKNVNISNKHKSSKLKTKYRMSIIKHVLLIVCFVVLEGSSFICGGFIELNILEPGSINQYFSLLSVVCFVICILLSIHIRDNDRRVLNVNCQCICTHGHSLWSNISEASGLRCATPQEPSTF